MRSRTRPTSWRSTARTRCARSRSWRASRSGTGSRSRSRSCRRCRTSARSVSGSPATRAGRTGSATPGRPALPARGLAGKAAERFGGQVPQIVVWRRGPEQAHPLMGARGPQKPGREMRCMGAEDPVAFSAGPLVPGGDRPGVRVVVTGLGPVSSIGLGAAAFCAALREGRSGISPIRGFEAMPAELVGRFPANRLAHAVSEELAVTGESVTIATACAASNYALGYAYDSLVGGDADVVVAGGAESVCRFVHAGFYRLGVLTEKACAPFDPDRDGI